VPPRFVWAADRLGSGQARVRWGGILRHRNLAWTGELPCQARPDVVSDNVRQRRRPARFGTC